VPAGGTAEEVGTAVQDGGGQREHDHHDSGSLEIDGQNNIPSSSVD
jgi:hypothetical protein